MSENSGPATASPRRRPLALPVVFFVSGISLAALFGPIAALAALAGAVAVLCAERMGRRDLSLLALCAGLALLLGTLRYAHFVSPPGYSSLSSMPEGKPIPVRLRAVLLHVPPFASGAGREARTRLVARVESIEKGGRWADCAGKIRIHAQGEFEGLARGDRVEILGLLRDLPRPGNPGQFDYGEYLGNTGIQKTVSVPSPSMVRLLREGRPGFRRSIERIRNHLARSLAETVPGVDGALLLALLLGEQSRLSKESRNVFVRSGTVHLLAVSGLHLMLVVSGLFFLLRLLGIHGRPAAIIILALVWFFVGLTGARTPVLRAAIMTTLYFGADLLGRERDVWNALALAAGVLLWIRPTDLFTPGFQLSFAAVAGIALFSDPIASFLLAEERLVLKLSTMPADRLRAGAARLAGVSVAVSISAWIATAPLAVYHFHVVAPVVPLANLLAAPLTALALAVGFLALPWIALFPGSGILDVLAGAPAWFLHECARFFAWLPLSHFHLPAPAFWRIALGFSLLVLLAFRRQWPRAARRISWTLPAAAAGLAFFFPASPAPPSCLNMTVLDVGHGSGTVLRFPDGRVMLYDAGTKSAFDVGEAVIAPFLWEKGIRRIDLLALSHADSDHVNAVESLLDRFEVKRAVVPCGFTRRTEGGEVVKALSRRGVRTDFLARASKVPSGWEDVLEVLHPPAPPRDLRTFSANNGSLTLAVSYGNRRVLLPGDLEALGLSILTATPSGRGFDVVLAPHHGSNEVEGNAPIARERPEVVVMSCGWSFRVEATADLYRSNGARVLRTCEHGAVTVTIDDDGSIRAESFRQSTEVLDEDKSRVD